MPESPKKIQIQYYALLREQRGESGETLETQAETAAELYTDLKAQYGFRLPPELLKVAINGEFKPWETKLSDGDLVVFIPPVAGG